MRVSWGRVENFKCVDYFQIEYFEPNDKPGTFGVSERIARHNNSFDIDVKPCRDYLFIVCREGDQLPRNDNACCRSWHLKTGRG